MSALSNTLACPRCGNELSGFSCKACQLDYPVIDDIPWLFAEPSATRTDWRNRYQFALADFTSLQQHTQQALNESGNEEISSATRSRLQRLIAGYESQIEATKTLLGGLEFGPMADLTTYLALKTRLPPQAQLFSYDANVFRDWCWGEQENTISINAVMDILQDQTPQRILVLGAGAGRLAYDLHQRLRPELTVALDMNPLLSAITRRLSNGARVELVEFPRSPIDAHSVALPRTLKAPEPAAEGMEVVLADAMRPPFVPGSFDLVLTPWLIDVVDTPPGEFLQRLNPLLKKGGAWIHHGSLAFTHANPLDRPDLIELAALAERNGFENITSEEVTAPYLDSPVSRHARRETIVTLRGRKAADVGELPKYQSLPDWLAKGRTPIPLLPAFQTQAMSTRIHAFIMSLVDGKRSLLDIAALLEKQQLMSKTDAEVAIRGFLIKMFEEAVQRGR